MVVSFLSMRLSFYGVTLNHLVNACVKLEIFADTNIPDDEQMLDNNQKRGKLTSCNTVEEFLMDPNFSKYVGKYNATTFYGIL